MSQTHFKFTDLPRDLRYKILELIPYKLAFGLSRETWQYYSIQIGRDVHETIQTYKMYPRFIRMRAIKNYRLSCTNQPIRARMYISINRTKIRTYIVNLVQYSMFYESTFGDISTI